MKSFAFKLQGLLGIREQSKEEQLREYAHALQKRMLQEQACNELREKIENLCGNGAGAVTFEPTERIRTWNAISIMAERLKEENKCLDHLKKKEAERLSFLLKAKVDLEVLNKLKDKQEKSFYMNERMSEEKVLNDWTNREFGFGLAES